MTMTRQLKILLIMIAAVVASCPGGTARDKDRQDGNRPFPEENVRKEAGIIVEKLSLKGDSAEIFENTYLEYRRKIHDALESHKGIRGARRGKRLTEDQVESNIKNRFACARAILDIREKYYGRFRKVLSPSQYERFSYVEQSIGDKMRNEHQRRARAGKQTRQNE